MARAPFPIRERNWLGGPVDIKTHEWVHQNLQLYGDAIQKVAAAFATDDPFAALGLEVCCEYILPFKVQARYHYANWTLKAVFELGRWVTP